jgi:hypothetical protein
MKDSIIKEKMQEEDGKLHIVRQQDVSEILKMTKHLRDVSPSRKGDANWRLAGKIPLVIAEQWSRECKAGIGTQEFAAYVKKKLQDSDWAYLRVRGY